MAIEKFTTSDNIIANDSSNVLVSVIIPAYNAEKYLPKCLDSVLKQTHTNLDIILVNDGSTDSTPQIARSYVDKDKRVRVVDKKNQGVSEARNRGIAEAKGEYISFVDADDWIHPSMIETLCFLAIKYDAEMSACGICRTEEEIETELPNTGKETLFGREEYIKKFFKIGSQETVYYCYNKLYKRKIVDEQFFPGFDIGEDVVSTFKAITRSSKIATTDSSLYYYRQGSGITTSFNDKYFQLIQVWEEVAELAKNESPRYLEWVAVNQARINFTLLTQLALAEAHSDEKYAAKKRELLMNLKKSKKRLLHSDINFFRKIGIQLYCMNYNAAASAVRRFVRRKQ